LLEAADIPSMYVHSVESVFEDPHLVETGYFERHEHPTEGRIVHLPCAGKWTGSPPSIRRLAPQLGEHTVEVLSQAGMGEVEIQALLDSGNGKQAETV
jgi:crotonobetainyl-CoA:carnitine CoA-transferase CaiB-like acyl-CoA transferase